MRWSLFLILFNSCLLLISCDPWGHSRREPALIRDEAYVPIYGYDSLLRKIENTTVQPTVKAGKIYVLGKLLFQVEELKGVHVIDYADKNNPKKIAFIKSEGCNDLAVKNEYLILNNFNDLVTVNISDLQHVKESSRIRKAFKSYYAQRFQYKLPTLQRGKYYQCPDISKGDVVGWNLQKKVSRANCQTY